MTCAPVPPAAVLKSAALVTTTGVAEPPPVVPGVDSAVTAAHPERGPTGGGVSQPPSDGLDGESTGASAPSAVSPEASAGGVASTATLASPLSVVTGPASVDPAPLSAPMASDLLAS